MFHLHSLTVSLISIVILSSHLLLHTEVAVFLQIVHPSLLCVRCDVAMTVKMSSAVLMALTSCGLLDGCNVSGQRIICIFRIKRYLLPERWLLLARTHGVTTCKTEVEDIFMPLCCLARTSHPNIIWWSRSC